MKAIIKRLTTSLEHGTFGVLLLNDLPVCVTLEESWLDNKPRESCIPCGKYNVTGYSGTKYKKVWKVHDVPGRSDILIHWGNTERNTAGCILVGQYYSNFGDRHGIANSIRTVEMLRKELPKEFTLVIEDCF